MCYNNINMTTPEAQDVQSLALPHVTDEMRRTLGEVVVAPPDTDLFSAEELAVIAQAPSELKKELREKTDNEKVILYRDVVFGESAEAAPLYKIYYVGINSSAAGASYALYKATEVDEPLRPLYQEPDSPTIASTFTAVVDGISKMTRKYRKTAEVLNDYKHRFRDAVSKKGLKESETTSLYFEESEHYSLSTDDPETRKKIQQLNDEGHNFGAKVTYFATCELSVMRWIEDSLGRVRWQGADPDDKLFSTIKSVVGLLSENKNVKAKIEKLDKNSLERKLLEQGVKDTDAKIIRMVVEAEDVFYQPKRASTQAFQERQEKNTVEDLSVRIDELDDIYEAAQKSSNVHLQGVAQASLMAVKLCMMPNTNAQQALLNNEVTIKAISDIVRESSKFIINPGDDGEAQSFEPAKVLHVVQQRLVEVLKSWCNENDLSEAEAKSFLSQYEDPVKFYATFFAGRGVTDENHTPDGVWQQYQKTYK